MWSTNWLVVRPDQVVAMVEVFDGNMRDLRDECRHFASFPDGCIEGSDLNRLWSIIRGKPGDGGHICDEVFRDGGKRDPYPKLGRVSAECVKALAQMGDAAIQSTAAAWQHTGILQYGTVDEAASVIRKLKELSQRAISEGQVILLVWWC